MKVTPQKEVNAVLDGGHAISAFWNGGGEEESIDHQETLPPSNVVGSCQLSHGRHCPAIVVCKSVGSGNWPSRSPSCRSLWDRLVV